jgi:hypothetical protein
MKERVNRVVAYLLVLVLVQQKWLWCATRSRSNSSSPQPHLVALAFTVVVGKRIRPSGQQLYSSSNSRSRSSIPPVATTELHLPDTFQTTTTISTTPNTPYQILYPDSFPAWDHEVTGHDISLTLFGALRVLCQAVERLATTTRDDDDETLSQLLLQQRTLRLEHVVSGGVDPLAWLHAQQQHPSFSNAAAVYFANQEDTLEAAGWGAAYVVCCDDHVLDHAVHAQLPVNALWYGGERFDRSYTGDTDTFTSTERNGATAPAMQKEWEPFGRAYWMLPSIELRRTVVGGTRQTTVAVTLVLPDKNVNSTTTTHTDYCDNNDVQAAWAATAAAALPLLRAVSDRSTAPVPPTTLPPVLVRDSSYNAADNDDGPEQYERAVAAALAALATTNQTNSVAGGVGAVAKNDVWSTGCGTGCIAKVEVWRTRGWTLVLSSSWWQRVYFYCIGGCISRILWLHSGTIVSNQ